MYVHSYTLSVLELLLVTCCTLGAATIGDDAPSAMIKVRNSDDGTDPRNNSLSALVSLLPLCVSLTLLVVRHTDGVACPTWRLLAPDEPALDCWEACSALTIPCHTISIHLDI